MIVFIVQECDTYFRDEPLSMKCLEIDEEINQREKKILQLKRILWDRREEESFKCHFSVDNCLTSQFPYGDGHWGGELDYCR